MLFRSSVAAMLDALALPRSVVTPVSLQEHFSLTAPFDGGVMPVADPTTAGPAAAAAAPLRLGLSLGLGLGITRGTYDTYSALTTALMRNDAPREALRMFWRLLAVAERLDADTAHGRLHLPVPVPENDADAAPEMDAAAGDSGSGSKLRVVPPSSFGAGRVSLRTPRAAAFAQTQSALLPSLPPRSEPAALRMRSALGAGVAVAGDAPPAVSVAVSWAHMLMYFGELSHRCAAIATADDPGALILADGGGASKTSKTGIEASALNVLDSQEEPLAAMLALPTVTPHPAAAATAERLAKGMQLLETRVKLGLPDLPESHFVSSDTPDDDLPADRPFPPAAKPAAAKPAVAKPAVAKPTAAKATTTKPAAPKPLSAAAASVAPRAAAAAASLVSLSGEFDWLELSARALVSEWARGPLRAAGNALVDAAAAGPCAALPPALAAAVGQPAAVAAAAAAGDAEAELAWAPNQALAAAARCRRQQLDANAARAAQQTGGAGTQVTLTGSTATAPVGPVVAPTPQVLTALVTFWAGRARARLSAGADAAAAVSLLESARAVSAYIALVEGLAPRPVTGGPDNAPAPSAVAHFSHSTAKLHHSATSSVKKPSASASASADVPADMHSSGLTETATSALSWRAALLFCSQAGDVLKLATKTRPQSALWSGPASAHARYALNRSALQLVQQQPLLTGGPEGAEFARKLEVEAADAVGVLSRRNAPAVLTDGDAAAGVELPVFAVLPDELAHKYWEEACVVGNDRVLNNTEVRRLKDVLKAFDVMRGVIITAVPDLAGSAV